MADSGMLRLIRPYSDSVNKNMEQVIADVGILLEKKQPEGGLGNIMTDALLIMAREKYATHVDAAFVNTGGIRLPAITPGPLTKGRVYELMPFDNLVLIQSLKGSVLQEFLDKVAAQGGWPVAGLTYAMKDKKAVDVKIAGVPIAADKIYVIVNSDYIVNGGDGMSMLTQIPAKNIGYLMRDAFIDYFSRLGREGKKLIAQPENRVTNVE